ncbi:hypothetical protein PCI56_13470 [Plesiomonas shigelloides subsp. oncorhynchi]|nr:hypothetical protein [Plesiomonas shigelloides]
MQQPLIAHHQNWKTAPSGQAIPRSLTPKLTYPDTAVVGMRLDPEQFNGGVPRRTYLMRGRLVRFRITMTHTQPHLYRFVDGNFKVAWTNPAWIFYDLVTCARAGLGKRLGTFGADKFALYMIGRYCDDLVDDGTAIKAPHDV